MNTEKNNKRKFILKIIEATFKFLSKMKCACCNSTCIVEKDCPETKPANGNG